MSTSAILLSLGWVRMDRIGQGPFSHTSYSGSVPPINKQKNTEYNLVNVEHGKFTVKKYKKGNYYRKLMLLRGESVGKNYILTLQVGTMLLLI